MRVVVVKHQEWVDEQRVTHALGQEELSGGPRCARLGRGVGVGRGVTD